VDVDGMKVNVKISELSAANAPQVQADAPPEAQVRIHRPLGRAARIQLDLRGQRVDEALRQLEDFLDDAVMGNLNEVRVVHGFGTGAIRQAVHERLTAHPCVVRYHVGRPNLDAGGEGVTHIEL
jgi:DNA mismatch repair protein MutS2